jgi:TonB family protein
MNGTLKLKIFLSVSLGIHLISFSTLTLLFPNFKIDRLPPLHIEVTLLMPALPVAVEKKFSLRNISSLPLKTQNKKEEKEPPQPSFQSVAKHIPLEEPKPLPIENGKWEMGNKKEEKTEKEPVSAAKVLLSPSDLDLNIWSDENPLPSKETSSGAENLSISLTPSDSEKLKGTPPPDTHFQEASRIVAKPKAPLDENTIFAQPRYAENPRPLYPQEARKKGYEGQVLLKVEVLANGRVGRVELKKSSGYEILDRSALNAVKEWRFIPAHQGNGSIPSWVNIPIKFQLQ